LKKREEKIRQVLKANEEIIQKKIEDYNIKQEKLRQLKLEQDERKKKKQLSYL
jgi:hypothetical protein